MPDLGLTFAPTAGNVSVGAGAPGQNSLSPVQDAIRILSFAVPRVVGASAIAPQALLGPNPFGSVLSNALLENYFRRTGGVPGPLPSVPMPPSAPRTYLGLPNERGYMPPFLPPSNPPAGGPNAPPTRIPLPSFTPGVSGTSEPKIVPPAAPELPTPAAPSAPSGSYTPNPERFAPAFMTRAPWR